MTKGRSCNYVNVIPHIGDYIEVFWLLHKSGYSNPENTWWRANVTSLDLSDRSEVIAHGNIKYCELNDFQEEICEVEFLSNRRLRACNSSDRNKKRAGTDPNQKTFVGNTRTRRSTGPELRWRNTPFKDECTSELRPHQFDSDSDFCFGEEHAPTGESSGRGIAKEAGTLQMDSRTASKDIDRLRESHVLVLERVEDLEIRLIAMENRAPDKGLEVPHVFTFLREKMVQALDSHSMCIPKKWIPNNTTIVDGLRTAAIRVRCDCDLGQFEKVALYIRQRSRNTDDEVLFDPPFSHTQSPSASRNVFKITFSNVIALFECMAVQSIDDRLGLTKRVTRTKRGSVIRILGTYEYNPLDEKDPAQLNMGGSLPDRKKGDHPISSCSLNIPVLERLSREWNMVDGCYTYPLTMSRDYPGGASDCSKQTGDCFELTWKRSGMKLKRSWSEEIRADAFSVGNLELCLPFVATNDDGTYKQVEKLVSDYELELFVAQRAPHKQENVMLPEMEGSK